VTSTNLVNLAKIGQLDTVPFSKDLVQRMLATAQQRLRDAAFTQNSNETRFDCAYTAIRAVADIGLHLSGYRTSTSKPGHHQTAIQCLAHTLGVAEPTVRILDSLRKQRNGTDYVGELVTQAALTECMNQAQVLLSIAKKVIQGDPRVLREKP
jgi:maltooligosyltrehalose synthase